MEFSAAELSGLFEAINQKEMAKLEQANQELRKMLKEAQAALSFVPVRRNDPE